MISHAVALAVLKRALEPGGVDRWATIDRAVPGRDDAWVVEELLDGRVRILEPREVQTGIMRFTLPITLEELGADRLTQDCVDGLLRGSIDIDSLPPAVADELIQISLFGKVFER
jgi:hypothetical protein